MRELLTWGDSDFQLTIDLGDGSFPHLRSITSTNGVSAQFDDELPLVEILTVGHGHVPANSRLVQTRIGLGLRYVSHETSSSDGVDNLVVRLSSAVPALDVELALSRPNGISAFRSSVTVTNLEPVDGVRLRSVTSWASPFGGGESGPDFGDWRATSGRSDWLAEGRWSEEQLRGDEFPDLAEHLTGHNPRGGRAVVSTGSWSTGRNLPVAGVSSAAQSIAWLWQVEHNGAWRWELGENSTDGYFALSGPTEIDHDWSVDLLPGDSFTTVPVGVAIATTSQGAVRELTAYRRAGRRKHPDNSSLGVVFNDYMNTLSGDPTTEKLLPLIDAAAESGAEVFCVDAGWYDDSGHWWDSVGEWKPSTTRFPNGIEEVMQRIRDRGMIPGLWLEPEVVGIKSPAAERLPYDAFFQRRGVRIVEHDRYHLDLRHPAAIAHLDEVVDRLVSTYGIGFIKLDYNINPGAGTDVGGDASGTGLLEHNRAHLAWLDSVLDRHPDLILENCGSGAMRMDYAMLSRLQLQSTSDQQDFLNYPPIAAAAPMSMLPEQAANWAYPQATMNDEELAFSLATGMLGRFYLSGYLNRMTPEQRATVREAVDANKAIRAQIAKSTPFWPLGLPEWRAPWVALGLETPASRFVTTWNRSAEVQDVTLHFPDLTGTDVDIRTVFPRNLSEWTTHWDKATGVLHVHNPAPSVGARTFELREMDASTT